MAKLAVVALATVGTVMANAGRARYLWVVVIPICFVTTTTMTAGVQLIQRFYAMAQSTVPSESFQGYLNVFLIIAMMICVAIILTEAVRKWLGPGLGSPIPSGKAAEA